MSSSSSSSSSSSQTGSAEPVTLLTAVRMKQAMDKIHTKYPKLGSVVTVPRANSELHDFDDEEAGEKPEEEDEDSERESNESDTKPGSKRPMTHNVFEQLHSLLQTCHRGSVSDVEVYDILTEARQRSLEACLENYFNLRVKITDQSDCDYAGKMDQVPKRILKKWWKHGHVSGYGNVRTQTNESDLSVRNAREWKGEEIEVDQVVNDCLAYWWGRTMQPDNVHVVLYKLNVYGPGGKFVAHKDTPETDLVGTILIGLGDSTDKAAGLKVEGRTQLWRANSGSFIMFYPDVTHEVLPVKNGYRATLAFKVFRKVTKFGGASRCNMIVSAIDAWANAKRELTNTHYMKVRLAETSLKNKWFPRRSQLFSPYESYNIYGYQCYHHSADNSSDNEKMTPEQEQELQAVKKSLEEEHEKALEEWRHNYQTVASSVEMTMISKGGFGFAAAASSDSSSASSSASNTFCFSELQAQLRHEVLERLKKRETPFGFLLDGQYALGTKDLRGPDQVLYELLSACPEFRVVILPVLTKYEAERYNCDNCQDHNEAAHVYPLTDAHVRGVLDDKLPSLSQACGISQAEASQMKRVPIFALQLRNGFKWVSHRQVGADHTGNEALPERENAIWLHRALIVVKKQDKPARMQRAPQQQKK